MPISAKKTTKGHCFTDLSEVRKVPLKMFVRSFAMFKELV